MASNITRDHHNLRRNLKLNSKHISNDGGDEGIAIDDDGIVSLKPYGQDVYEFGLTAAKFKYWGDDDDYLEIGVGSGGVSTIKTYADPDNDAASLNIQADGNLVLQGSGMQGVNIKALNKPTSNNVDSTLLIDETLDLSSGAGGSDIHYGIRYIQTQTNIGGWDSVYLMHIAGTADATNVFTIEQDAKVNCPELDISNSREDALALFINHDYDDTTATSKASIWVDLDRAGTVGSGTDTNIGIQTDVTATGASGGTINNYGQKIIVVGDSGGTSTNYGLDISCTSADTNYGIVATSANRQLRLAYDGSSYCDFTIADDSHATIATGESGNLILDAAGDINLDAAADVNIPADIGLTFGSDNEKIEGDGTNLTLNAAGRFTVATDSHIMLNSSTYTNITQTKDSATAATGSMGIRADYTRTGDISSGTNSFDHLKLTTTQTGASGGTHSITGINNIVISDNGGTVTAYGIKQSFQTVPGGALPSTMIGINSEHAGGTHMKLLYNATNYSTFTVSSSGDLNIETVGSGTTDSDIVLDADGDVLLDPAGKVGVTADKNMWFGDPEEYIVGDGTDLKIASSRHLTLDIAGSFFFDSAVGAFSFMDAGDSDDKFQITVAGDTGATTLETVSADTDGIMHIKAEGDTIELESESYIKCANPIQMQEFANAVGDTAGYGQIWVKNSTPNELYFTTDAGDDIQLTSGTSAAGGGGGGTSRWAHSWGGYKTNNGSSSVYYMQYYPNNNNWNNSESSPTSINYFDMYAAEWIAPANGTLTKIDVFVRGGTDDCQFYVFKGAPSETGSSSISLTQIGASGACGIDSASQTFHQTAAISSSNTFSAGEGLWIMIKKEAHSSNQSFYFSGTISGEYS